MSDSPGLLSLGLAGRYTLERELGRGGTAVVHLARDNAHDRLVAIKILRPELASLVSADRFLREIRVTAQLNHPNIVPVLDYGESDGTLYCVLPYMDGGTLRDRLKREKQLPLLEVIAIGRTIAAALEAAHAQKLIHRDVKPENILYSGGQACLADFGIARALERAAEESTTSTGIVRGTPAYMSPEQASGEHDYDGRSDIYSLACVLYEAIAGVAAFVGATSQAVVAQRLVHRPRPLHVYRPTVSPDLERVLDRALAVAPADRYQTAEEFGAALQAVEGQPGRTTAEARSEAAQGRRRRLIRAAAAVALTLVALGTWVVRNGASKLLSSRGDKLALLDTTTYVIFPFERDANLTRTLNDAQFARTALLRWNGISVVDGNRLREALANEDVSTLTIRKVRDIALRFGAGRYIQGNVVSDGSTIRLSARLYDFQRGQIAEASVRAEGGSTLDSTFARLVDDLLFFGTASSPRAEPSIGTSSLPARQSYLSGHSSLERWDLARADSQFDAATRFDGQFARAALWLALVRVWEERSTPTWSFLAEAASSRRGVLSARERMLAEALVAMAKDEWPRACGIWDELTRLDQNDFALWYGAGTCRTMDHAVLRDRVSPTGWRFRSSYHAALLNYRQAFQLHPAILRALRSNAFEKVRKLLKTSSTDLRIGYAVSPDTETFVGYPSLAGDTLLFTPVLASRLGAADSATLASLPRTVTDAVLRQRRLFRDIATTWVAAYPHSAEALEALGTALQLLGDASALDTLARAAALAQNDAERLRIRASDVWVRLKFSAPTDSVGIRLSRSLADSLLRVTEPTMVEPELMLSLAILTGRAERAAQIAAALRDTVVANEPAVLNSTAARLRAYAALGGPTDSLRVVEARLDSLIRLMVPPPLQRQARNRAFVRAATAAFPQYRLATIDSLESSGAYLIRLLTAWSRRDTRYVERELANLRTARQLWSAADAKIDAVMPETWLILQLGQPQRAIEWIDPTLASLRMSSSLDLVDGMRAGTLVRAMALRAELAERVGDHATARQWAGVVVQLWSNADSFLQPVVERMRSLTK